MNLWSRRHPQRTPPRAAVGPLAGGAALLHEKIRFRVLALAGSMLILALILTYLPDNLPKPLDTLVANVPSWLFTFGLGLILFWVLRDSVRDYAAQLVNTALGTGTLMGDLSDQAQFRIIEEGLRHQVPWCADALSAMLQRARTDRQSELKRNARYRFSVLPLREPLSIQLGTRHLKLDPSLYFKLHIEDKVISNAEFVRGEFVALFVIGEEHAYGEGLINAFRDPECIYRDVIALSKEDACSLAGAVEELSAEEKSAHLERLSLKDLVSIHIEVTPTEGIRYTLLPDRLEIDGGIIRAYFSGAGGGCGELVSDTVSLNIVAETPLLKERRSYPIILLSFTYDPEIKVRFHPECIIDHSWTSFLVSGASGPDGVIIENDADGNGYALHTRNQSKNIALWVLPGSGVMVTWTPR